MNFPSPFGNIVSFKMLAMDDTKSCCSCTTASILKETIFPNGLGKYSFFQDACNGRHKVMLFLYHCQWSCGATTTQLGMYTGWSKGKVNRWLGRIHEMISKIVRYNHEMIGGPGIVVEIDESKFGKRKYNKGHKVDGCWVFLGVALTPE